MIQFPAPRRRSRLRLPRRHHLRRRHPHPHRPRPHRQRPHRRRQASATPGRTASGRRRLPPSRGPRRSRLKPKLGARFVDVYPNGGPRPSCGPLVRGPNPIQMNSLIKSLHKAQPLLRRRDTDGAEQEAVLKRLRAAVPPQIMAHFMRAIEGGRNSVALVSHGVCGECHLRVPATTASSLAISDEIYLCENCGCYLLPTPEEIPGVAQSSNPSPAIAPRRRRRPVAVAG